MKYQIDLTAWYLNANRIYQILNCPELEQYFSTLQNSKGIIAIMSQEDMACSIVKRALEEWLQVNKVPTMGELFASGKFNKTGQLFTIYHDFYGNGLSEYSSSSKEIPRNAVAQIHNKLKYNKDYRLRVYYHPDNLQSQTAWSRLSGRTRLFVFGYIEKISDYEIHARPYVIGDLNSGFAARSPNRWDSANYGEVHPSQIDQFSSINNQFESENKPPEILEMKSISENEVKSAIAEIIHESTIPKDWGGEKSDLFSTNLSIDGRFMSAAFLLKGPAKFSPMKMIHLGKNGDQIERLYSEPADLLVLQHCHEVTNPVRATMRAYASRINDLRYFTIIDGYDTLRLLKSYNKCGF